MFPRPSSLSTSKASLSNRDGLQPNSNGLQIECFRSTHRKPRFVLVDPALGLDRHRDLFAGHALLEGQDALERSGGPVVRSRGPGGLEGYITIDRCPRDPIVPQVRYDWTTAPTVSPSSPYI